MEKGVAAVVEEAVTMTTTQTMTGQEPADQAGSRGSLPDVTAQMKMNDRAGNEARKGRAPLAWMLRKR